MKRQKTTELRNTMYSQGVEGGGRENGEENAEQVERNAEQYDLETDEEVEIQYYDEYDSSSTEEEIVPHSFKSFINALRATTPDKRYAYFTKYRYLVPELPSSDEEDESEEEEDEVNSSGRVTAPLEPWWRSGALRLRKPKFDTTIVDLPETCLLNVFSFLDLIALCRAARTCTKFCRVAYDSSLWVRVDLRKYQGKLDELRLTKLIKLRMAPLLYKINLSGFGVSQRVLLLLSDECPKLKVLSLESSNFLDKYTPSENSFPPHLENLDIRHSGGDVNAFRKIARCLRGIICLGLSDEFLQALVAAKELDLLYPKLQSVKILEFSYCTSLTDFMVGYIAAYCRKLQSFSLKRCNTYQGLSLPLIINSCTLLTSLVLDGTAITDASLQSIRWENSHLKEIDLSWCRHVTEDGLKAILPSLWRLTYMRLCCCGYGHALTDRVLDAMRLKRSYTKLEIMDISYSNEISNQGLAEVANVCPALQYLRMHHCKKITSMFMSLINPDVKAFIVANFQVDEDLKRMRDHPLRSKFSGWPAPGSLRSLSLDNAMAWK